jgi:tRNA G18 (ribose-2'-O)-methylase SpoU
MKTIKKISKENDIIQKAIALYRSRQKRFKDKHFLVESVAALNMAKQYNWDLVSLFVHSRPHYSQWAQSMIEHYKKKPTYEIPTLLFEKITDKSDLPELIAVFAARYTLLNELKIDAQPQNLILLDSPKSAGNVGTILRSGLAFGIDGIIISGRAADIYDPQCVTSSLGALFALPIYFVENATQFSQFILKLKNEFPIKCIATGDKGISILDKKIFNSDCNIILIGNETHGISLAYQNLADDFIRIPLHSSTFTSLNAGVAASILMYEVTKKLTSNNALDA